MICKVCGRNIANDSANFCEYCGASVREDNHSDSFGNVQSQQYQQENMQQQANQYQQGYQQGQPNQANTSLQNEEKEQPISFKNWLWTMLLQLIPIVYIVMLFVWAFDGDTPKSKKNWARATLVVALIGLVLAVILIATVFGAIGSSGISLEDLTNTTYY